MFGLNNVLTTILLSAETVTGQGLSSVLAETLIKDALILSQFYIQIKKKSNHVIFLHKIRVDGTAGGVFRELVHDISGCICAPRLSDICLA